jgi:hypothetical protein
MTIALRNFILPGLLAAILAGCGGGGGGGGGDEPAPTPTPNPSTNPPPVPDVSLAQLQGSWFGTFDSSGTLMAMQVDIDANGNITDLRLNGTSTDLTGPITKAAAAEGQRLFRFVLREAANPTAAFNQGALLVDSTATHLFYVDEFFQTAVVQKAASAPSATYAQADINGSWAGDSAKTAGVTASPGGTGFGTFTQASSTASCQAAAPASSCTITVGSITRNAPALTLNGASGGRWTGTYTETPDVPGSDKAINVYVSPDKTYAGAFSCATLTDFTTCNFYSLKKQ